MAFNILDSFKLSALLAESFNQLLRVLFRYYILKFDIKYLILVSLVEIF